MSDLKAQLVKIVTDLLPFLYILGILVFMKLIFWLIKHIDD